MPKKESNKYQRYQVIPDDLYADNSSGSYLFVDTQKDKILAILDTEQQAKRLKSMYLHELYNGNHQGLELPEEIMDKLYEQVYQN